MASDKHILSNFGDPNTSWAFEYNLYADKWLGTNLLDDSVSSWSFEIALVHADGDDVGL